MIELITRTARLVPYAKRPKQVPSFVVASSYEPAADDPLLFLGNLFIVLEVLVAGRSSEDVADLIINTFRDSYYDPNVVHDVSPISRFESATKAVNIALVEHVNQGNAAWIGKLSAIITVQCGSELHVTHIGSAEAFLYRGAATTQITLKSDTRPTSPSKTFGSIASGSLEAGDRFLLATPALVHQVALKRLHSVVASNTPNTAIGELTELLKGTDVTRIAALIVEITTPELAALQVRSDQPDEIAIGGPENPMEAAKMMAMPLAQATVETGKRASQAAQASWVQTKPVFVRAYQSGSGALRTIATGNQVAKRSLFGFAVVVFVSSIVLWIMHSNSQGKVAIGKYNAAFDHFVSAGKATNDVAKRQQLSAVQAELETLIGRTRLTTLNHLLVRAKLMPGEPSDANRLVSQVNADLDRLDGITHISGSLVTSYSTNGTMLSYLEQSASNLYIISSKNGSITIVDKTTRSIIKSSANQSIGSITAVSLSGNHDGLYLLSEAPSVWFYRFTTNSYSQLTIGTTGWENGTSIASYGSNIYILSGNTVDKHLKTSSGFAPALTSLPAGTTVPSPSAITVDGFIYIAGSDGLYQYLSGTVQGSEPARSGLAEIVRLHSDDQNNIIGVDTKTGRIGHWTDSKGLIYIGQFSLKNAATIDDAIYDATSKTFYATAAGKLLSFQAKP
jgi:hypothetical protein